MWHAGALTCAVATVVGEVTNPMQNVWFLAKDTGAAALHAALSPVFTYFFVFVRVVLTPLWSTHGVAATAAGAARAAATTPPPAPLLPVADASAASAVEPMVLHEVGRPD